MDGALQQQRCYLAAGAFEKKMEHLLFIAEFYI
jgi:hypothetical protein